MHQEIWENEMKLKCHESIEMNVSSFFYFINFSRLYVMMLYTETTHCRHSDSDIIDIILNGLVIKYWLKSCICPALSPCLID